MKNGLIISDSGPIFSLAIIDKLKVLDALFESVYLPKAVWEELTKDKTLNSLNGILKKHSEEDIEHDA